VEGVANFAGLVTETRSRGFVLCCSGGLCCFTEVVLRRVAADIVHSWRSVCRGGFVELVLGGVATDSGDAAAVSVVHPSWTGVVADTEAIVAADGSGANHTCDMTHLCVMTHLRAVCVYVITPVCATPHICNRPRVKGRNPYECASTKPARFFVILPTNAAACLFPTTVFLAWACVWVCACAWERNRSDWCDHTHVCDMTLEVKFAHDYYARVCVGERGCVCV